MRTPYRHSFRFLFSVSLLWLPWIVSAEVVQPQVSIDAITQTTKTLTFKFPPVNLSSSSSTSNADDQPISMTGLTAYRQPGQLSLPFKTELLAIPTDASVSVQVLHADYHDEVVSLIAPTDTNSLSSAFYPPAIADIGFTGKLRGLPVAQLRIFPVQYEADLQVLRVYEAITVQVTVDKPYTNKQMGVVGAAAMSPSDNAFSAIYSHTLLNPSDVSGVSP